ncbi:unnamed protein product [Sphagnum jensenii]|uniref:Uncharacterized protein n=1 Tax=Sphagnum jensenii TaxID=128206 RepID=A0ABP1BAM5_9BRYO
MCERCCTEELEWRPLNGHGGRLAAPNYDLRWSCNYGKVGFERRRMRRCGVVADQDRQREKDKNGQMVVGKWERHREEGSVMQGSLGHGIFRCASAQAKRL